MHYILLLYVVFAFALFILPSGLKKHVGIILALVQALFFGYFFSKIPEATTDNGIVTIIQWIPQIGLNLEFLLNGLSLVFALLITGIGTLVFLYASAYMKSYEATDKFYFQLFLFGGAMLGLVLSANLIQLFVFWELTSYLSFLLISFFHKKEAARKAAFQSLIITALGGLLLLTGVLLLGSVVDSYSIIDWLENAQSIKNSQLYLPGLLLILGGAFTKSAQFPFHFWLPGAMEAPTPVSAYLHSATMVKAGIFLLALLNPVLGGTIEWTYIITLVGITTMFLGAYFSITQTDLKAILAFTTISSLGVLVLLFGIDTMLSVKAAMLFLFVHAFYKAALFMVAGFIDKKTGTKDLSKLGGLYKHMPLTFIISILALLSMAGLPPTLGFLGKELIYEAKIQSPGIASLVLILGVAGNTLIVAVSMYFMFKVFLGKEGNYPKKPDEKGFLYLLGPGVLTLLSLLLGISPAVLGNVLVGPALSSIRKEIIDVELILWHGFNNVFFLSLITVLLGVTIFIIALHKKQFLIKWRSINNRIFSVELTHIFHQLLNGFLNFSERSTKRLQHGYHRYYILTVIVFSSALLWFEVYITRNWVMETQFSLTPLYVSGLAAIITCSTIYAAIARSRIATIISMGVTGYGISLIYLYYSAVDLAITQILVETLVVVMFVLVLQRLPLFETLSSKLTRIRDLIISLIFGGVMTVLALKALNIQFNHSISKLMVENSFVKAHGKNVVNVILVDFRALDTLGEVTVLIIAAMGVFVLLKTKKT